MSDKLTVEDARTLRYYHEEKRIDRCSTWSVKQAAIERDFPEVVAAVKAVEMAERTLDAVVKSMTDKVERENPDE